jgi:hypothetical protein
MFTSLMMLVVAARLECLKVDQELLQSTIQIRMQDAATEQKTFEAASSFIRVYDVRDIEFIVRRYDRVPQMLLDESDRNSPQENHELRGKSAIQILKMFVTPDKWDTDPVNYSISYWEGLVIVRAPKAVHDLIR